MNFQGRRFRNGETIYSEWFQRGGDNAIFRAEMINSDVPTSGGITVKFEFYTKNADATSSTDGTGVEVSGSSTLYNVEIADDDTDIQQVVIESGTAANKGFQELVRVKATVTAGGDDNWLLGRMFPPVWYDASVPSS